MAEFIIDNSSVSVEAIKQDLITEINNQPDADEWQVFISTTSGSKFLDLIAGLGAFYKYDSIIARREAYLAHALSRSSIIGGAQQNGYSAFRGRNAVISMTITPSGSGIYPKYHILGTVKDRDIILLNETTYSIGVPVVLSAVIGELKTETKIAPDGTLNMFRYTQKRVSDDHRILIGAVEVETSDNALDMLSGKFNTISNPLGSVDAKYLNLLSFTTIYSTGSIITLEWVDLKDIDFTLIDVALDEAEGTLDAVELSSIFVSQETNVAIKVNAPLHSDVNQTIRAREDQPKLFKTLDTTILDATGQDVTAAVFNIFYIRENNFLFSPIEVNALVSEYEVHRPHGIQPPIVLGPTRIPLIMKVDLYLTGVLGDPSGDTEALISVLENLLQQTIDLHSLEASIEALDTVQIARLAYDANDWSAATTYEVGGMVKASPDTGRLFEVQEIIYFSDSVEPVWPVINLGTIIDNDLIWVASPKDDLAGFTNWSADTGYRIGDQVRPIVPNGFVFTATDIINTSDSIEPTWTPLLGGTPEDIQRNYVVDKDILWISRPQVGTPSVWVADTDYKKGGLVIATDQITSDTIGVMFQAFAYLGTTDGVQPSFSGILNATTDDNNIKWRTIDPQVIIKESNENEFFEILKNIVIN